MTEIRDAKKMISALLSPVLLALAAALSLSACSLSLTDHAQTHQPAHVATKGTNCLSRAFDTVENYSSGAAKVQDVNDAWTCGISALDSFMTLAKGKDPSFYTANSLRTFLEQNFLDKTKISDTLLNQVMLLKQVVLGGDVDRVTRDEVSRARQIFLTLQTESVNVLPYIRVLTMKDDPEPAKGQTQKVEDALHQLAKTSAVLGGLLSQARAPYDLSQVETLLREVQLIYTQNGSQWDGPNWLIENLPVVYHSKAVLVRPSGQVIAPTEWTQLCVRGSELFGIFLRIRYLMHDDELLNGSGLEQLKLTIEHAIDTVHESVLAKEDHVIPYELIDPLIDDVIRLKIINWKVRASTWQALSRVLFEKVLNPPGGQSGVRPPRGGITEDNLAHLHEMAEGWIESQKDWTELSRRAMLRDPTLAANRSIPLTLVSELWPQIVSKAPRQHADFAMLFARKFPIDYTFDGAVIFEPDRSKVWVDQAMFDSMNWKQTFIRGVILGYSSAPEENRYKGVTLDEFHNFFDDGRTLGADLGFLDPTDNKVWSSVFTELNIFTLSADNGQGDSGKYVSYNEGIDFISNAVSSAHSSHLFYADLLANCQHESPDQFGIPRWTAACYRDRFKKSFSSVYRFFPQWVKMASAYTPAEMSLFQTDFEKAARKLGVSEVLVESTDIDRGSMIMHYIESLYTRFDTDQSGTLNAKEATAAFPLLRDLIADAANSQDDRMLLSVFTYLMKYGQAPTSIADKFYFEVYWKNCPSHWNFEADRHQLLRIVANLNSKAGD